MSLVFSEVRRLLSLMVTNHFVHPDVAERYDRFRPYYHPAVIKRVRERLHLTGPVRCALDVGCGTGHSARALRAIADEVVATDVSAAMLAQAPVTEGIRYVECPAEELPFGAGEFPLLTVSMAVHWFDRPRFLAEAARVLAPGGWLALYGYTFTKRLPGCPEFTTWFREEYFRRYPRTVRNDTIETPADLEPHGLAWRERTEYLETRRYTAETFARSLLTHSNVVCAVEEGKDTFASAEAWLTGELGRLMGASPRDVEFSGWLTLIQKT